MNNSKDGVYFVEYMELNQYFNGIIISYIDDNYIHSSVKVLNATTAPKRFEFNLTSTLDGFIGMDYYDTRMYPRGCKNSSTLANLRIYKDGKYFGWYYMMDYQHYAFVH